MTLAVSLAGANGAFYYAYVTERRNATCFNQTVAACQKPNQDLDTCTSELFVKKFSGGAFTTLPGPELNSGWAISAAPNTHLMNPSLATWHDGATGHDHLSVLVAAHAYLVLGCGPDVATLKEYDFDLTTNTLAAPITVYTGAVGCLDVGHSDVEVLADSPVKLKACWTVKGGLNNDDELCATRTAQAGAAWTTPATPEWVSIGAQDHGSLAGRASNGAAREACHDTNGNTDDKEDLAVRLYQPSGAFLPAGDGLDLCPVALSGTTCPGSQQRPSLSLDANDNPRIAFEDKAALNAAQTVKFARCPSALAEYCDQATEWQHMSGPAVSVTDFDVKFPSLITTTLRDFFSVELDSTQNGTDPYKDVRVATRCVSAATNDPWTLEDPYANGAGENECTEEYGVPHVAARTITVAGLPQTRIGVVSIRYVPSAGEYRAMLYEEVQATCP